MRKEEIRALAGTLGLDLVGFTTLERLDRRLPPELRPSNISQYLPTFLILARHIPAGVSGARQSEAKTAASALVHRALEEAAGELAYRLEEHDYLAVFIPSLVMDFRHRTELDNTPAGQSSLFLRLAAVEAGLGTLGLNNMLLTPRFGPRVYLAGLMSNLQVEPDPPLAEELCPGLEQCGRCAAICPAGAIPRQARRDAPLEEYRGLEAEACARESQPYGVRKFVEHTRQILEERDPAAMRAKIESPTTSRLWHHMAILRQGAFTGCSRCLEVCPVGEDYDRVQQSPGRQKDLPAQLSLTVEGDLVRLD